MTTANMGVLSGLSLVAVPVVSKVNKTEQTDKSKREKREAKRAIMRNRKAMYESYVSTYKGRQVAFLQNVNMPRDSYNCRCLAGSEARNGHPYLKVGQEVSVSSPFTEETIKLKVALAASGLNYVPAPRHTFRRKVSSGETQEQFINRMMGSFHECLSAGWSFIDEACNCNGCRNMRSAAYSSYMANDPKVMSDRAILNWDRDHNPFSEHYRFRVQPRIRRDDDGNPLPRRSGGPTRWPGAGIGGETFSDPKAKGGAARLVGLEIEHNRDVRGSYGWAERWNGAQVIGDGSCGREAVTPPIAGEHIRKCITDICNVLNTENAGCDSRCGLHVHVDARDMRWADMLRFLTVFCRVESLLFLIGGQNRYSKTSSYCIPVAELYGKALRCPDPKGAILAAACIGDRPAQEGRDLMRISPPGKKGNGRYKSINIMPWIAGRAYNRKDTTVEFRLHRGSHNAERLIHWAELCQDIVDWCIRSSNADVDNLPKSSARALMVMSPRSAAWILGRIKGWRAATTAGKVPLEDDVGNYKPRRIVSMKNGLYLVDHNRCSYRRDQ